MSRRNLSRDEKGQLKHEKAAKGSRGLHLDKSPFPLERKRKYKSPSLLFSSFFDAFGRGKQQQQQNLQLFIAWQAKEEVGSSGVCIQAG